VSSISSVLLFTGSAGLSFGYNFDGPQPDDSYSYTGEGQVGDQTLTRGNKAVFRNELTLRLFEQAGRGEVRYVGEFEVDRHDPVGIRDVASKSRP
jgi:hypothetical protein